MSTIVEPKEELFPKWYTDMMLKEKLGIQKRKDSNDRL